MFRKRPKGGGFHSGRSLNDYSLYETLGIASLVNFLFDFVWKLLLA
jgi:hypothetical protein